MKTLIVINSSNPEPQNSEQYQLEHPDEQFTVVNYDFGPSQEHADANVLKNFRQTYKNQDYDKVVLAFQFPSHVVSPAAPGLADPLARALKHAFLDYGVDMPWEVEHYTGFKFPKICHWEIDAPPTYDFGAFMAWLPENVYKVKLVPYQTYNAYQVRRVAIPRRSFWLDGNNATIRLHEGGKVTTPYPTSGTDANALTHHRYRVQDVTIKYGDVGLQLNATNHAIVENVQCEGQALAGFRTEMALSTTMRNCKVTHCKGNSYLFTYGRWPNGGRFRAPTVKLSAQMCEAYIGGADGIGFVWDNVEAGYMADCTVQGGAALHDVVVSASGQDDVFSARLQTAVGNSSVVKHFKCERLHIEGHFASAGSIYANLPPQATAILEQVMWHGNDGVPLVYAGGWVLMNGHGWCPRNASIRTRVEGPRIRFDDCHKGWKDLPLQNLERLDGKKDIDTTAYQFQSSNW